MLEKGLDPDINGNQIWVVRMFERLTEQNSILRSHGNRKSYSRVDPYG
jgi:hypothetical protein